MKSIVKRCTAAAVLIIAATLPGYNQLHTSEAGLRLIANFEGCRLSPYQCQAGVWTNGIGHTAGVNPQGLITERQAAANLIDDVLRVERAINRCITAPMSQPIYDAVVSFAFNVGSSAVCTSTLAGFINQGEGRKACNQLPRWIYVEGIVSKGLVNRRQAEQALCLSGL